MEGVGCKKSNWLSIFHNFLLQNYVLTMENQHSKSVPTALPIQMQTMYNADWHRNLLYCTIPSFRAEIDEIILDGHVLTYHLKQLHEFVALERATVEFEPTEPYFDLELSLDSRKKVLVKGHIQYPAGWGAELRFEFETDLTHVDHFVNGIESILREFPAKR